MSSPALNLQVTSIRVGHGPLPDPRPVKTGNVVYTLTGSGEPRPVIRLVPDRTAGRFIFRHKGKKHRNRKNYPPVVGLLEKLRRKYG